MEQFLTEERFANGRVCPHCGATHIVRNGHGKNGTQRYKCMDCNKSFVITSNSITSRTKKDFDVWQKYISCMMNGFSIRKSAQICDIHSKTAFIWRHKILDALQSMADNVSLDGIIEADETFFAVSYKGNHKNSKRFSMPRLPHLRGKDNQKRGISSDKVCVPCAINHQGLSISKIATKGKIQISKLHQLYDGRIKSGSTLCTDCEKAYRKFTKSNHLNLIQLKSGKTKKGMYSIQHINNFHQQLKRFMGKFNGVSSKYLNNYLIWNNFINYSKETYNEKLQILLKYVLSLPMNINGCELSNRPAIPVL